MRNYRGPEGDERIWFDPGEIETIVDDELRKARLEPPTSNPVVDVERFLERHLKTSLDVNASLPADVLGQTEFSKDGAALVSVNKDLTGAMEDLETTATVGRWRATLAHEAGHVVLHRHLFYLDSRQASLFPTDAGRPKLMRCLKRDVSLSRRASDWREVQANQAMASLLMPQHLFRPLAIERCRHLHLAEEPLAADSPEAHILAAAMASLFAVSRAAAAIRLATLGMTVGDAAAALLV